MYKRLGFKKIKDSSCMTKRQTYIGNIKTSIVNQNNL